MQYKSNKRKQAYRNVKSCTQSTIFINTDHKEATQLPTNHYGAPESHVL